MKKNKFHIGDVVRCLHSKIFGKISGPDSKNSDWIYIRIILIKNRELVYQNVMIRKDAIEKK